MGYTPSERDRVRRFWGAPNLAQGEGLKAVQLFEAIAAGSIKALWVMGTNPAVSLPRADHMREAMRGLDLLVVSENVIHNDTIDLAHVRLPASAWGEKDGTVTNSERRISRQRKFLAPPGEARPDWWIVSQVAHRLGWGGAFAYRCASDIFREHAALSTFENGGTRLFDLSGLSRLSEDEYDRLEPIQWPVRKLDRGTERLFANGGFAFPSGRARIVPIARGQVASPTTEQWPLVLNTGRVRDQWHTMTRTGMSPRLAVHIAEPFVEIHPADAAALGLEHGRLARVTSAHGEAVLRVLASDNQQPGSVFVPMHWSAENSSLARACALVQSATDPFSGQPEAKATPCRIAPLAMSHYGFVLTRQPIETADLSYWTKARMTAGEAVFFALEAPPPTWSDWADRLLPQGERLAYQDAGSGQFRAAVLRDQRLEGLVYVADGPTLPSVEWLKACFTLSAIAKKDRRSLLAGRSVDHADEGPIVCACFQVGRTRIEAAIDKGAGTAKDIGIATRAGTNCGSCLPELKRLAAAAAIPLVTAAE
jgi:assimilatory nitrate reductase catalytic subunit